MIKQPTRGNSGWLFSFERGLSRDFGGIILVNKMKILLTLEEATHANLPIRLKFLLYRRFTFSFLI